MVQARRTKGCRDFVVAADPLEPGRVNVHEEWESEAELEAFRGSGPEPDLAVDIFTPTWRDTTSLRQGLPDPTAGAGKAGLIRWYHVLVEAPKHTLLSGGTT